MLQHDGRPAGRRTLLHLPRSRPGSDRHPAKRIHDHTRCGRPRLRIETRHRQRRSGRPAHLSERCHDFPNLGTRRFQSGLRTGARRLLLRSGTRRRTRRIQSSRRPRRGNGRCPGEPEKRGLADKTHGRRRCRIAVRPAGRDRIL